MATFFLLPQVTWGGESVTLVTASYEPYVITDGSRQGFFVDLIKAAFAESDVDVNIKYLPWKRCEMMVAEGEVFAAFPYSRSEEERPYAFFADTVWADRFLFFYREAWRSHFDFTSYDDLRGVRIGGTWGYFYIEHFKAQSLDLDLAVDEASGLRKLNEGRVDVLIDMELAGWSLIRKHYPGNESLFHATQTAWKELDVTLMVSKKFSGSKRLMALFNAGLRAIRENGEFDRIVESYDLVPSLGQQN